MATVTSVAVLNSVLAKFKVEMDRVIHFFLLFDLGVGKVLSSPQQFFLSFCSLFFLYLFPI